MTRRAPTAVIIPSDVQELPYSAPGHAFKMVPSSIGINWPSACRAKTALQRAADVLNAGSKVAILAGQGARGARAELEQVAALLAAGVAKPLLGKDVLSDDLPYVTGSIGLLGTRPSYEMMKNCDTLLTVGSSFPYTQFLPDFGQARGVQIDIDGSLIGMRYPFEVNLVGDAAATLRALIPLLERKQDQILAGGHRGRRGPLVGGHGGRGHGRGRPGQPDAAVPRAVPAAARRRDRRRRLRVRGQLVRPAAAVPRRRPRVAVGHAGDHGPRRSRTASAPSSPRRAGPRSCSPATGPCR